MKKCKCCEYCECVGRAKKTSNSRSGYSRKEYMCENPKIKDVPLDAFGGKMRGFIGFGDNTYNSPVQIKSAPRWCPEK